MQNSFPYLDILIFGVIAIFLIFRLKNILGTKTGFEETNHNKKSTDEKFSNVVTLKTKIDELEDVELKKILEVDPNFDVVDFLSGSKTFFEMVLKSFVDGNLENIKNFTKPSVLQSFKTAINERDKEQETLIIDLKSIQKNEIISSKVSRTAIKISVIFESLQVRALLDKNSKIIDGDRQKEILVKDEWIFERKINENGPNWTLIETKSN